MESCYRTTSTMVNPIVDWSDEDVWEFLHYYNCESNPLYQEGRKRIGCIGCPLAGRKERLWEFDRYPEYKRKYIYAFDRMLKARLEAGKENRENWRNGEAVFDWWMGDKI